jgi:abequosyltransferase
VRITRYYPNECVIPAGRQAILACFRRVVCMSGLIIDRDLAVAAETDQWDGSLFYQHWIVGKVLAERSALYIPDLMVHFRLGSPRSFGTAEAERHLYVPGQEPPETTYKGVYYQFAIADALEASTGIHLSQDIRRDYANYSYPQFAFHRPRSLRDYFRLYRMLGGLGLYRFASFHAWFVAVGLLGPTLVGKMLDRVRRMVGHTPNITRALSARRVSRRQTGEPTAA